MHQVIQDFLLKYYNEYTIDYLNKNRDIVTNDCFNSLGEKLFEKFQNKKFNTNNSVNQESLIEYYEYGIKCIEEYIKKVSKYFPKRNWAISAIEYQLIYPYKLNNEEILFRGYIDVLLYNQKENKYKIIDLKTSRTTWNDTQKKDEFKRMQLLLYKYFISLEKNVELDNIDVEFLILKKTVYQHPDYYISRIQRVSVPNSKVTINRYIKLMNEILTDIIESIKLDNFQPNPNKLCKYCQHYKFIKYCKKGIYERQKIQDINCGES